MDNLIEKFTVQIGGEDCDRFRVENGGLTANIKHVGGDQEDCFLCNLYSKLLIENPGRFMYLHGSVHKLEGSEWCGYFGGTCVDCICESIYYLTDRLMVPGNKIIAGSLIGDSSD